MFINEAYSATWPAPLWRSEADLRIAFAAYLRAHKWEIAERVRCAAGEADLSQSGGCHPVVPSRS